MTLRRASQPQLPTMAGGDVVGIDGDADMVERAAAKDEDPKFAAEVAHLEDLGSSREAMSVVVREELLFPIAGAHDAKVGGTQPAGHHAVLEVGEEGQGRA